MALTGVGVMTARNPKARIARTPNVNGLFMAISSGEKFRRIYPDLPARSRMPRPQGAEAGQAREPDPDTKARRFELRP